MGGEEVAFGEAHYGVGYAFCEVFAGEVFRVVSAMAVSIVGKLVGRMIGTYWSIYMTNLVLSAV